MYRRSLAVVSAVALAIATPTAALAAAPDDDPSSRFQQSDSRGAVGTTERPLSVDADGRVTVVVEMKGDPVAVVQAEKGSDLTTAERNSVKSTLKKAQDAIAGSIKSKGGKIEAKMQSAYNGIQATVPGRAGRRGRRAAERRRRSRRQDLHARQRRLGAVPRRARRCGRAPATRARTSRSRSSTPASTTRTPTSAAPARSRPTTAANAAETQPADPAQFGPTAPRIKGGYDFVGDDYNAERSTAAFRSPTPTRSTATVTAATSPVRPRGSGVDGRRHDLHRSVRRVDPVEVVRHRPGRCTRGRPVRAPRLRLRGLDERHRPRHRLGSRQRHGRHQHVARLAASAVATTPTRSPSPTRSARASSS